MVIVVIITIIDIIIDIIILVVIVMLVVQHAHVDAQTTQVTTLSSNSAR